MSPTEQLKKFNQQYAKKNTKKHVKTEAANHQTFDYDAQNCNYQRIGKQPVPENSMPQVNTREFVSNVKKENYDVSQAMSKTQLSQHLLQLAQPASMLTNTHMTIQQKASFVPAYPASVHNTGLNIDQASKIWQDYLASTMANQMRQTNFTSLLKHISDISNKKKADENMTNQMKNIYDLILQQQVYQKNLQQKDTVLSSTSTSVLSSSSPSSSCSSQFGNSSQFNSYEIPSAKMEPKLNDGINTDSVIENDLNNSSGDEYINEDYDESKTRCEDDLYDMTYKSKTSTPCSTNCSPALSISSVISTDVKTEKKLIKFSIDNILGGGGAMQESTGQAGFKRKYEASSPALSEEDVYVKRSRFF